MNPRIPITDKRFEYTNAACTDLRTKFARIREQQQAAAAPKQSEYVSTIIQLFNERREEK